jgi:hypothetical protein
VRCDRSAGRLTLRFNWYSGWSSDRGWCITGHAHRTVGETYGEYDLRTLKEKIDLVRFGVEG